MTQANTLIQEELSRIIANIKTDASETNNQTSPFDLEHTEDSIDIFKRLLFRNSKLSLLSKVNFELLEKYNKFEERGKIVVQNTRKINKNTEKTKSKTERNEDVSEHIRYYSNDELALRYATIDLFVETAISHLEKDSENYKKKGKNYYDLGITTIAVGIAVSFSFMLYCINNVALSENINWGALTLKFITGFTFYGFLVIAAVGLTRFGKAMLDQSERLSETKHALREGRLHMHLIDKEISIEDISKLFNWNMKGNQNAFSNLETDNKAPWGTVFSDVIKATANAVKPGRRKI